MKSACKAIALLVAVSATRLLAQPYTFDENGRGTMGPPFFGPSPMSFQVAPDPTGGITNVPVLIYSLQFPVVSGDLALTNSNGTIDDLLRFFTPSGGEYSSLIFYARTNFFGNSALANVGIPPSTNPYAISEDIPTTTWYPAGANQPGCPTGGIPTYATFQYNILLVQANQRVSVSGTNFIWDLANGPDNVMFRVVATTNLALPLTNWLWVSTNSFDQSGNCTLILPMDPDKPNRFYGLGLPVP